MTEQVKRENNGRRSKGMESQAHRELAFLFWERDVFYSDVKKKTRFDMNIYSSSRSLVTGENV